MDSSPTRTSGHDAVPLQSVVEAWRILRPALWPTRLLRCPALDEISGYRVWLKPENLQHTGSYKIRGAFYKLHRLKELKGTRKVIAASAGNHAQGVAYAARELGMDCVIVMPERAPLPKRRATLRYGAQVVLHGSCFDDALAYALQYAPSEGREFISPYDDPDVITGQGTLAWEIVEELRDSPPDAIVVPVGGGGLLAGVASVIEQAAPRCRLVAVQSTSAPAFVKSWEAWRAVKSGAPAPAEPLPWNVPTQETIADGVRVSRPGDLPWRIARDSVAAAFALDDARIYQGIVLLAEQAKLVAEGAGALGAATLIDPASRKKLSEAGIDPGSSVVALVTGGNIDTLTLQRVLERSIAATGREMTIAVRIKDEPGELGHVLDFLRRKRATVLDMRRSWNSRALISDMADIEILIETEDERHGREVLQELAQEAKARNFELLREPEQPDSGSPN